MPTGMMGDVSTTEQPPTPLVGRSRELEQLRVLAGVGEDPRPAAVVLGGDAGVGKTRLLSELRTSALSSGWQVLVGHCLDFGDSALPYLPFSEILGRLTAVQPDLMTELVQAHPAISRLQPGRRLLAQQGSSPTPSGRSEGDESMARGELLDGVHHALSRLASSAPVVVIVEDVHWADRSSRDLLSFLFARGFETPVSIVVSYRSDDLHRRHPLRSTLAEWAACRGWLAMNLEALSDADLRSLIQTVHPARIPERELVEIVARADGNAFFAEELLGAHDVDHGSLPTDLADLLLLRLDRLGDQGRAVVRAAACSGRRVPHLLLAEVVGLAPESLDLALREAVEAHILVPVDADAYAFRHALLAEAVHDDLLPGERTRLHAAYVAALVSGRATSTAAELARHARAAHDLPTAVAASIEAGDDAMAVGGPDEAARHYEHALEILSDPSVARGLDVDLVPLTLRAADALMVSGQDQRSVALLRDQLTQLGPELRPDQRAQLLVALATVALLSDDTSQNPLSVISEALDVLPDGPSELRARALSVRARVNVDRARFEEATRCAQEALQMATELDAPKVAVEAATTLGRLKELAGDPRASVVALTEVLDQARDAGDVIAQIRALHQLGAALLELGRPAQARSSYEDAYALAEEHGRRWAPYAFDSRVLAGLTAYMTGDWAAVDRIADSSGQAPPPQREVLLDTLRLIVAAGRGDEQGRRLLGRVQPALGRDGWVAILATGPAIDLLGDAGDLDGAQAALDHGIACVQSLWGAATFQAQIRLGALMVGQLATHAPRSNLSDRTRYVERGRDLLVTAEDVTRATHELGRSHGPEGRAWLARIRAEHLRLRWLAGVDSPSEADLLVAWRATVVEFDDLGHVFEAARSRARLAGVLRAHGDHAAADRAVASAQAVAEQLRAEPLLAELRSVGVPRTPPAAAVTTPGPAGRVALTPREVEVLRLVAQGRTNGEIARQLFISTKTVSVHVSNILAKLGAGGRTEAAALARRQDLIT